MTPETFCEHFATFAEAPNGVAKLRELILQLAVQGRLVPQDVNDEPVEMLMETIDRERVRPEMAITTASSRVADASAPHTLPATWCWLPLTNVFVPISAGDKKLKTTEYQKAGRFPVIDQGQRFIAGYTDDEEKLTHLPGPVVIFGDHTKELKFVDFDFAQGADGIKILRPIGVDARYFYLVLRSYSLDDRGYGRHYKILLSQLFPLPPLAEQRRIVGKVDQLLGLCDELAARQAARREARSALVGATLDRLVSARSAAEFPAHAHRLRDHFDRLFDTPSTIPQLRQAILQLAVQGQLVPQDPNDEPASVLLNTISTDWSTLATQMKIRSREAIGDMADGSEPFPAPATWKWAMLGCLGITQTGSTPSTQDATNFGDFIAFVKPGDMSPSGIDYANEGLSATGIKNGRLIPAGSVLMVCIGGSIGKAGIVDRDVSCNQQINAMTPARSIDGKYLLIALRSAYFQRLVQARAGQGTLPILSKSKWEMIPVPVPPLSEQKRIVSKVTELLSLCDALEAKLTQAESASTQLLSAAVHHLLHTQSKAKSNVVSP